MYSLYLTLQVKWLKQVIQVVPLSNDFFPMHSLFKMDQLCYSCSVMYCTIYQIISNNDRRTTFEVDVAGVTGISRIFYIPANLLTFFTFYGWPWLICCLQHYHFREMKWTSSSPHLCTYWLNWAGELPENGERNEMTLSSRRTILSLAVVGRELYLSVTEPHPNIESLRVSVEKTLVASKSEYQSGVQTRDLWLSRQAALTTAPGRQMGTYHT